MIRWVIRGALTAKKLSQVWLATDDEEIADVGRQEGIEVALTDPELPSGSDRCWAAISDVDCEIVVNLQGDEPLLQGGLIDEVVQPLLDERDLDASTAGHDISVAELLEPSVVKVLRNQASRAITFSRFPVPYSRRKEAELYQLPMPLACLRHMGIYAYRKDFLRRFCESPPVAMEFEESLEQLRALYLGAQMFVVQSQYRSYGVDLPRDLERIERIAVATPEGLLQERKS